MEFTCRYASTVVGASCSRGENPRRSGDVMPRPTHSRLAEADGDVRSISITTPPEPCPFRFPSYYFTQLMTPAFAAAGRCPMQADVAW